MRFFLTALLFLTTAYANANPTCLQTFDVKADKKVSDFTWLPGATPSLGPLNCRSLELSRQAYFVANQKMIDVAKLAQVKDYNAEITNSIAALEKAQSDLQAKLSQDATIDALRITYRVLKYEFGKVSALVGCFAPEPSVSKAFCAIGLVILAEDTASVLDGTIAKTEISDGAKKLGGRVGELKAQYAKLKQKEASFNMSLAQKQHTQVFLGMCEAVRASCL